MSYVTVKDDEGKVVMTFQIDSGIKVEDVLEMIDQGLQKLGTEVAS